MLSLVVNVVVFIDDNAGQLGTTIIKEWRNIVFVVNVVVFIDDNAGQLGTTL